MTKSSVHPITKDFAPEPHRYLDNFTPESYKLNLAIDKKSEIFSGDITIQGEVKEKTIFLHAVNLEIAKILVDDHETSFASDSEKIILACQPLGPHQIEIFFSGHLNHNMEGAYVSTYDLNGQTEKIIATQFESHYARECFPCIDEPAGKATFSVTLAINNPDDQVLSNMPEKDRKIIATPKFFEDLKTKNLELGHENLPPVSSSDKYSENSLASETSTWQSVTFETTPRMSTYLLAFVIGKFHQKTVINQDNIKITSYCAQNQSESLLDFPTKVATESLEFYTHEFKTSFPLKELKQVALPDFEAGAMENWGLVTYRESMFLANQTSSLDAKKTAATTIAHELSHQWFGDLVTMRWWDDLWLNESFANVMEYYCIDRLFPEYHIFDDFFAGDCVAALNRDAYPDVQAVHETVESPAEIASIFDGAIVYAKGAHLIFMLIREMGWSNFVKGLKDYFDQFKYQNTTGNDLWQSLQPYADFDVSNFMSTWINQPGFPIVGTNGSQHRFLLAKPKEDEKSSRELWPIPKLQDDMSGHYVIALTDAELQEKLNSFACLSHEQKLRLFIDQRLIAKTPAKSSATLLDLLPKVKTENSAALWTIVHAIIKDFEIFFASASHEEQLFKNFIGKLVHPKLTEIGLVGDPQAKNTDLRTILLSLSLYSEIDVDPQKQRFHYLEKLSQLYCEDFSRINPDSRFAILRAKIQTSPEVFDYFLKTYQKIADPDLKSDLFLAFTTTRLEANIQKLLPLLEAPSVIRPENHFSFFYKLFQNPAAHDRAFDWLIKNWPYVESLGGDASIDYYPRYMAKLIRTESDAKKFRDFFATVKNPALPRVLQIAYSEIDNNLNLIKTDGVAVANKLKDFNS